MANTVTIAPSVGNAPFPTQGGVGASPGFDAIDYRRFWSRLYSEGVLGDGSGWRVNEAAAGPNMTVEVWADRGPALVEGDAVSDQGLYYVAAHSAVVSLDVSAADATNPRVDRVVLEVLDDTHDGSGSTLAQVRIITGAPTAGATLDNYSGAPAVPDSALHLADVLVAAGATSIGSAAIRDYRAWGEREARVGQIIASGDPIARPGWVACEGQTLNRAQFARLYGTIGVTYGAGDGSLTFGVPDLQGRAPFMRDNSAGRVVNNRFRGDAGGIERTILSVTEVPPHSHDAGTLSADEAGNHTHNLPRTTYGGGAAGSQSSFALDWSDFATGPEPTAYDGVHGHEVIGSTGSTGSGQSHENMPPYLMVDYYIFTGSAVGS